MKEIDIRPIADGDFDAVWSIFQEILASGDKYPFDDASREACRNYWYGAGVKTWVAVLNGERLLGMYRLVANQADRGAHVASASYMVSPAAQGVGVGRLLGNHSLEQARLDGYLAMQFNYVVSTNVAAVVLWEAARLCHCRHPAQGLPPPEARLRGRVRDVPPAGRPEQLAAVSPC